MNRYKCVLLLMCVSLTWAQASDNQPDAAFVSKVEGLGSLIEAIPTPQGYISISRKDTGTYVIRKTSNTGQRVWEKEINTSDYLTGVAQTIDGYVFVGWQKAYYDYGIDNTGFIFKLNNNGTFKWSKSFSFSTETNMSFDSIQSRPDGGFFVIGHTSQPPNTIVASFTSNGEILWSKRLEGLGRISSSQQVPNGLILVAILRSGLKSSSQRILKISDTGQIEWKKVINGIDIRRAVSAPNNSVILAGTSATSTLSLVQLSAHGKIEWTEAYSVSVHSVNVSGLSQTPDGGYAIVGTKSNQGGGGLDGILLEINAKRDVVFQTAFGIPGTPETGRSVLTKSGGGYVLFGSSGFYDTLLLSVNSKGVVPGCNFFKNLTASKIASPAVTSEKLDIANVNFAFPTPSTIHIPLSDSETSSSSSCP